MEKYAGKIQKERMHQLSSYARETPQAIQNMSLSGQVDGSLKVNLLGGHDFVLLPERAWTLLVAWYGGGPLHFHAR